MGNNVTWAAEVEDLDWCVPTLYAHSGFWEGGRIGYNSYLPPNTLYTSLSNNYLSNPNQILDLYMIHFGASLEIY